MKPNPEPSGVPLMFGAESWKRPDQAAPAAPAARPERPAIPDKVSPDSLRRFLGEKRLAEWQSACTDFGLDFNQHFREAGHLANHGQSHEAYGRHLDAKGHLRVLICDAMRSALQQPEHADRPLPVLY